MIDAVSQILREAAALDILPRYRELRDDEIHEKSPGELVTRADRDAESRIGRRLAALLPGSRVVGEEAASADPTLLRDIDRGAVWLLDPLDGTRNFVHGREGFAVMAALLRDGETTMAWMLSPLCDRMHVAELGAGARIDGRPIPAASDHPRPASALRGAVLTGFLPNALRERVARNARHVAEVLPGRQCAGEEYPLVATGAQDFVMFWRTLPWDHAPGSLFVREAGGHCARPDGTPYRPAGPGEGLLVARSTEDWQALRDALLGAC